MLARIRKNLLERPSSFDRSNASARWAAAFPRLAASVPWAAVASWGPSVRWAAALGLLALAVLPPPIGAALRPRELLIYYSWPSLINGANGSVPAAAAEFGQYDDIVLGDLIEKTSHPDHANTVAILQHPALAATRVFGYVDLGVAPGQNLPPSEIETRILEWQATGADGILFDEYGYDYAVTRARQNDAVNFAHGLGMVVIANAWIPGDALSAAIHPTGNPTGLPSVLGPNDIYLYESYQIQEGAYVPGVFWQSKSAELEAYRNSIGIDIFAVTTSLATDIFDPSKWDYTWYSALLQGYNSVGWGEYLFAALTAVAPFRTRPGVDPGTSYLGPIVAQGSTYRRATNLGGIFVDTVTRAAGFTLGVTGAGEIPLQSGAALGDAGATLRTWPEPFDRELTLEFEASTPGQAALPGTASLFTIDGRRIGTFPLERRGAIPGGALLRGALPADLLPRTAGAYVIAIDGLRGAARVIHRRP